MWIKELRTDERRTLRACLAGWTLDSFDVNVFAYVITGLIALHILTKPQAGILGTSALLNLSLGGWITGILLNGAGRGLYAAGNDCLVCGLHLFVRLGPEL